VEDHEVRARCALHRFAKDRLSRSEIAHFCQDATLDRSTQDPRHQVGVSRRFLRRIGSAQGFLGPAQREERSRQDGGNGREVARLSQRMQTPVRAPRDALGVIRPASEKLDIGVEPIRSFNLRASHIRSHVSKSGQLSPSSRDAVAPHRHAEQPRGSSN
jgi:hypothetical protein